MTVRQAYLLDTFFIYSVYFAAPNQAYCHQLHLFFTNQECHRVVLPPEKSLIPERKKQHN